MSAISGWWVATCWRRSASSSPRAAIRRASSRCARSISAAAASRWRCRRAPRSKGRVTLRGKRIATTYPYLLEKYLRDRDIVAEIVTLSGAVEIAPRLGRADLICDLVSTGSTLQANHLREVETVLESHAVLIRTPLDLPPDEG